MTMNSFVLSSFKPEEITVRLGEYDFSQVSEARRDFGAEVIFMHESYDRKTYKNDIALIKLKEKTTFNNDIWPICLPPSNIVLEGQSAYVTGLIFINQILNTSYIKWFDFLFKIQVGVQHRTAGKPAMFY